MKHTSLYDLVVRIGCECDRMSPCGQKAYEQLFHVFESEYATEAEVDAHTRKAKAKVKPCPCGGGKARRIESGEEIPMAIIDDDGTLQCVECGRDIEQPDAEKILSEQQLNDAVCSWEHCFWGVISLPEKQWDNPKKFTVRCGDQLNEDEASAFEEELTPERKTLRNCGHAYLTVNRSQLHKASLQLIREYPHKATELLTNPDSVITELLFQIALFGKPVFG